MFTYGILLLCVGSSLARYRIINGDDTPISDYPHQVSLQVECSSNTAGSGYCHICGGSILSAGWVLTAAHCVEGSPASRFYIGAEFQEGKLSEAYTIISVDEIFMHPMYNNGTGAYPNDVALLRLSSDIDLVNSNQKAINMADTYDNFDGDKCYISGWGRNENDVIPDQLQSTHGTIDPYCGAWSTNNYNSEVHICIHNINTGSCSGDSGGPMVCRGLLAGVTSWGAAGCITNYPSVYARVSTYREWIDRIMGN